MTKIANVLLTATSSPLRFPVYLAIEITLSVFLERLKKSELARNKFVSFSK